jgi:7-carboxy-7-deazaguanine synthase
MIIPKASKVLTPAQYGAVAPPPGKWPINYDRPDSVALNKVYPTIQGEGGQVGTPMTIVRLQGCPIECRFCDTPESWEPANLAQWWHVDEVASLTRSHPPNWALVTGGEPTWYDLNLLTRAFHKVGLKTALETSGTFPITGVWDWITISPKPAGKVPLMELNIHQTDEVKWVIGRRDDITYVAQIEVNFEEKGLLSHKPRWSIQPMSASRKATEICLEALMEHPNWALSLQTHKTMDIA